MQAKIHTLNLSTREIETILSALESVSPSGGGSDPFTLFRAIGAKTSVNTRENLTSEFCNNVVRDYLESING